MRVTELEVHAACTTLGAARGQVCTHRTTHLKFIIYIHEKMLNVSSSLQNRLLFQGVASVRTISSDFNGILKFFVVRQARRYRFRYVRSELSD